MPNDPNDPFFTSPGGLTRHQVVPEFLGGNPNLGPQDFAHAIAAGHPDHSIQPNLALQAFLQEAVNVRNQGRARFADASGRLDTALDRFSTADPFSAEEANLMFAQGQEQGLDAAVRSQASLRNILGQAGVTGGGVAAGLAANIDLERMRQREGVIQNVRLTAMERNAAREREILQSEFGRANFVREGPEGEDVGLNALGQATGLLETRRADREAQDAAEDEADRRFISDLVTGGLTFSGGFL